MKQIHWLNKNGEAIFWNVFSVWFLSILGAVSDCFFFSLCYCFDPGFDVVSFNFITDSAESPESFVLLSFLAIHDWNKTTILIGL